MNISENEFRVHCIYQLVCKKIERLSCLNIQLNSEIQSELEMCYKCYICPNSLYGLRIQSMDGDEDPDQTLDLKAHWIRQHERSVEDFAHIQLVPNSYVLAYLSFATCISNHLTKTECYHT